MRKNKKLLLGAIAAMGVLAIGTGAVSTMAWYRSEQSFTAVLGNQSISLTAAKETADGEEVHLDFTLSSVVDPELTDPTDGEAYYVVEDADHNLVKVKNSSATKIGQYQIIVAWRSGDQKLWAHAAKTGSVKIEVTKVAQDEHHIYAELLKSDATDAKAASVVNSHSYTVNIAANGDLSWASDNNSGKYALRPGYTGAQEDVFTADEPGSNKMSFADLLVISQAD